MKHYFKKENIYLAIISIKLGLMSPNAMAALSDRFNFIRGEGASFFDLVLFGVFIFGICLFAAALVSFGLRKKAGNQSRQEPWELWGLIIGAALTIVLPLVGDFGESLGGQGGGPVQPTSSFR